MLIQTDKDSGKSLYCVVYFETPTKLGEVKFHANGLHEANAIARRVFGPKNVRKIVSVGLTVGGFEDANGVHI